MIDMIARAMASKALEQGGAAQYSSKLEFPSVGKEGQLYIDTVNNLIYYWDSETLTYKNLNISEGTEEVSKEVVTEVIENSVFIGGNASTV